MAMSYIHADEDDRRILDDLIAEFRPDLKLHEVTIALLFAYNESGRPAIVVRGQAVAGKIKINSEQDRVEGKADATIVVDGKGWAQWRPRRRAALIHHELCHLATANGDRDGHDRPVLTSRFPDWDFDGFDEIVERYGADSFESSNLHAVAKRHAQLKLFSPDSPISQAEPTGLDTTPPQTPSVAEKAPRKPAKASKGEDKPEQPPR